MKSSPLILLIGANNRFNYLNQIGKEMEELKDLLAPVTERLGFDLEAFAYTDSHKLLAYLNDNRERLVLLHFAGHSNSDLLQLDDGEFHARGLAAKLGSFPHLQLVVLNGCQNEAQVKLLRAANVPAVIGTHLPINDQVAQDFTRAFYTGLAKHGLPVTDAFIQSYQDVEIHHGQNFRSLDIQIPAENQVWSWFLDPPQADWKLADAATPCKRLPPLPYVKLPEKPFKSLRHYEETDAGIFFGRCQELMEVMERLDTMPADVLLIYSGAGIGKSSFLAAGLLPRLRARQQQIGYCRYNEFDPARDELEQMFGSAEIAAIRARLDQPTATGLPAVWIIDQLEEVFLRSEHLTDSHLPVSLARLMQTLHAVFTPVDGVPSPKAKIVLTLREEWFARLLAACQEYGISQISYPLKPLDKPAISDIICAFTQIPVLQQAYRLRIEPSSAEFARRIADDLLADKYSNIGPTLQIILSRLWERVEVLDERVWDMAAYEAEMHDGSLLEVYLNQQLDDIATRENWGQEARDNGLLLDVLFAHATQQGTSKNLSAADYERRYSHIAYRAPLLQALKERSLLIDASTKAEGYRISQTRLAHDTLAQLIENRYDASLLPGQRARRILDGRKAEWQKSEDHRHEKPPLGDYDLKLVENGQNGTSNWREDACETAIMHKSCRARRNRTIRRWSLITALAIFFGGVVIFAWLSYQQAVKATIYSLLSNAQAIVERGNQDGDLALLLTLHAEQLDSRQDHSSDIYKVMSQILNKTGSSRYQKSSYQAVIGDELWVFNPDGKLRVWDMNRGEEIRVSHVQARQHIPTAHAFYAGYAGGKTLLVTFDAKHNTLLFWDKAGYQPQLPSIPVDSSFSGEMYFSSAGQLITWDPENRLINFWDSQQGRQIAAHQPALRSYEKVFFSPQGRMISIDERGGKLRFWDDGYQSPEGKPIDSRQSISDTAFTPNGTFVTIDKTKGTLRFWNEYGELKGKGRIPIGSDNKMAFADNREWVMIDHGENVLYFGGHDDKSRNQEPTRTEQAHISFMQFSVSGSLVTKDDNDNTGSVRFWDSQGRVIGNAQETIPFEFADGVRFSPSLLEPLAVWDSKNGKLCLDIEGRLAPIVTEQVLEDVVFSSKGEFATLDNEHQTLRFWSATGKPLSKMIPTGQSVSEIRFMNANLLVTADFQNGSVCFWNLHGKLGCPNENQPEHHVSAIRFFEDKRLVTIDKDQGTLRFWDGKGKLLTPTPIKAGQVIRDAAFSRREGTTAKPLFITVGRDGSLRVWDASGKQVSEGPIQTGLDNVSLIALPKGVVGLWSNTSQEYRIWNPKLENSLSVKRKYSGHEAIVWNKQFHSFLSYSRVTGDASLWKIETSTVKPVIEHFQLPGELKAFSRDAKHLAFLNKHNKAVILPFKDFTREGFHQRACEVANRDLTPEECDKYIGKQLPWHTCLVDCSM